MTARLVRAALLVACAAASGASLALAGGDGRPPPLTPAEEAKVELGRRLFFDPAVCRARHALVRFDCHDPAHGLLRRAGRVARRPSA